MKIHVSSFPFREQVTNEEAAAVKQIAGKAGGDWSKLSAEEYDSFLQKT